MTWDPPPTFPFPITPQPNPTLTQKETIMLNSTATRNVVVDYLEGVGWSAEEINSLIAEVNDKAGPVPEWEPVEQFITIEATFTVDVRFEDVPLNGTTYSMLSDLSNYDIAELIDEAGYTIEDGETLDITFEEGRIR